MTGPGANASRFGSFSSNGGVSIARSWARPGLRGALPELGPQGSALPGS